MTSVIAYVCNHSVHAAYKAYRELVFNGTCLEAYDGYGDVVDWWDAKSNSGPEDQFKGRTPEGRYLVDDVIIVDHPRMVGNDGFGYAAKLHYTGNSWPADRGIDTFWIHPDTCNNGTYGCIGINPNQHNSFYDFLTNHLELNYNIAVQVRY
jgi:hypothetical protein